MLPPQNQKTFRLQRSMLSVPGINPHMFEKAANSDADALMFDCEDSVAIDDKEQARENIIAALNERDWLSVNKSVVVRVNPIDTPFMYKDVIEMVESGAGGIDTVMLPKVNNASDVWFLSSLLDQIEMHLGLDKSIGIEVLIETAAGAMNLNEIACSSPRLEALHFGAGDFAASCRARTVSIGGISLDYPGDQWHYIMQRIVIAARANGLRPIDSAYGNFNDDVGYTETLKRGAAMGFEGKWAIHPKQIPLANSLMTPSTHDVEQAKEVIEAMQWAAKNKKGAATLNGQMIDIASIRMAQHIINTDAAIKSKYV